MTTPEDNTQKNTIQSSDRTSDMDDLAIQALDHIPISETRQPVQKTSRCVRMCKGVKLRGPITVEPVIVLFLMAYSASIPLTQQLIYAIVADDYNYTNPNSTAPPTCGMNQSDAEWILQQEVQATTSKWMLIIRACETIPSIMVTLLMGAYSDKAGRKFAIVIPLIGSIFRAIWTALVLFCRLPIGLILIGAFTEGAMGGIGTLMMAAFSYIADVTTQDQRSFRIVVIEIAIALGSAISQIAIGYLIKYVHFAYSFVIILFILCLAFVYGTCIIPETIVNDPEAKLFDIKLIKAIFKLYSKDDGTKRLWKLQLTVLLLFVTCVVEIGGTDVFTLYLMNTPFCWDSIKIGYIFGITMVIRNTGAICTAKIAERYIHDMALLIMAGVSAVIAFILFSLATSYVLLLIGKKFIYFSGSED